MPQLALETFFTQYFWLLVVLSAFLLTSTFYVIPRISYMIKVREKIAHSEIIDDNLEGGQQSRSENTRNESSFDLNIRVAAPALTHSASASHNKNLIKSTEGNLGEWARSVALSSSAGSSKNRKG